MKLYVQSAYLVTLLEKTPFLRERSVLQPDGDFCVSAKQLLLKIM